MTLNDRQTFRQLLHTRRFWMAVSAGSVELGLKYQAIPLHGVLLDIAFAAAWLAMLGACIAVGIWQPAREHWGHEQKLRESARRIAEGLPPLEGYEHMLEPPPLRLPPPPREGE